MDSLLNKVSLFSGFFLSIGESSSNSYDYLLSKELSAIELLAFSFSASISA